MFLLDKKLNRKMAQTLNFENNGMVAAIEHYAAYPLQDSSWHSGKLVVIIYITPNNYISKEFPEYEQSKAEDWLLNEISYPKSMLMLKYLT